MNAERPQSAVRQPWRAVYGSADGRWYVVAGPDDMPPPPVVERMPYLGAPRELVQLVRDRWHAEGQGTQRKLADLLTVSQQTASRYVHGAPVSDLSPLGWKRLVVEVFEGGGPR